MWRPVYIIGHLAQCRALFGPYAVVRLLLIMVSDLWAGDDREEGWETSTIDTVPVWWAPMTRRIFSFFYHTLFPFFFGAAAISCPPSFPFFLSPPFSTFELFFFFTAIFHQLGLFYVWYVCGSRLVALTCSTYFYIYNLLQYLLKNVKIYKLTMGMRFHTACQDYLC